MSKQMFDEFVGTPPQSTVDVRAIVSREKRARVRRRVSTSLASVIAVAALAAAGFTLRLPDRPLAVAQSPSSTPSSVVDDPGRFSLASEDQESSAAVAERLSQALDEAVKTHAPGARWLPIDQPLRPAGSGGTFYGNSEIAVDGRIGLVSLSVLAFSPGATCPPQAGSAPTRECDPDAGARQLEGMFSCAYAGESATACVPGSVASGRTRLVRMSSQPPKQPMNGLYITVELPDHRVLQLEATNTSYRTASQSFVPVQEDPVLSEAQLTAIAFEIASQIKP